MAVTSSFIKAEARRLFAQRQASGYYRADGTVAPTKPVDGTDEDEKDPEDLTDEEADKELETTKQRWNSMIRYQMDQSGCDYSKAHSRVARLNPQLRERMVSLANRPRQSRRSRR